MPLSQHDVIQLLIQKRNDLLGLKYALKDEPDKTNRTPKEVDALCECDEGLPLAIDVRQIRSPRAGLGSRGPSAEERRR